MQYHMPTNNNIVYVSIKTKWYALFLFYNIFATIQTTAKDYDKCARDLYYI